MRLFGIILNREPTPDKVGGDEFVILSEVKDLDGGRAKERFFATEAQNDKMKERFFATNAQNDTYPVVILNEVKDLGGGRAKERFFALNAQNDMVAGRHGSLPLRRGGQDGRASRVENRNPAYELPSTSSTTTWSPFSKEKAKDVRPLRKDDQNDTHPVVILNEVKDLDSGKTEESFFAKDAQNDIVAGRHGSLPLRRGGQDGRASRVENRNPAYELPSTSSTTTWSPFSKEKAKDVRPLRKEAKNYTHPVVILNEVKDLDSGKTEVRFFAKDAQNDRTKERFFAKEAQNDRNRRTTPSLRDAPSKKGVKGGTVRDRSLRKEAQNDKSIRMTFVVVCLMLLFLVVSPVGAQEPTTRLFLNPTPLVIDTTISPTGVVTLEVADGVDIFAFDLFVQYDPSLLSVSQVALGDFLGEGLFCMDMVNDPGLVHYSCTRFGVNTGVTGSGVLLELTFVANGQAGDTILSLANSQLFESQDAFLVDATLEDGAVSVRPYWSYLPLILSASGQGTEALL